MLPRVPARPEPLGQRAVAVADVQDESLGRGQRGDDRVLEGDEAAIPLEGLLVHALSIPPLPVVGGAVLRIGRHGPLR